MEVFIHMEVKKITRENFADYGRILSEGWSVADMISAMDQFSIEEGVVYFPSITELEKLEETKVNAEQFGGGLPVQTGYCIGYNNKLDAFEYHRSSEINIAATDFIVILGLQRDIDADYHYDTAKAEAFFVPKGSIVEFYATTLHYAPCSVDGKQFKAIVMLPKGTNEPLSLQSEVNAELKLLTAQNKWLIAHAEAGIDGAFVGLDGENLTI